VPTRYFLGKPEIGEELSISIEQGKVLTIKLLAVGTLNTDKGTREVFFELNGEVSAAGSVVMWRCGICADGFRRARSLSRTRTLRSST
jgi:hypothetical protein